MGKKIGFPKFVGMATGIAIGANHERVCGICHVYSIEGISFFRTV